MSNQWQTLWENKSLEGERATLGKLIAMVGWKDENGDDLPVASWIEFVDFIGKKLEVTGRSSILEVGCGPGGMLMPYYEAGHKVSGIDYSQSMIAICKQVMPDGDFYTGEANTLPYGGEKFDALISNSVFHYFPNLEYAEQVIKEMARVLKPGALGTVLDANDLGKKEAFMQHRYARFGGREEHDRQNKGLSQMFYDKHWFLEVGEKYGLAGSIEDQCITWYRNSQYRFNYFFKKL